ncbi:hypothetical protein CEXT_193121 [Caerostris extrusa]|uniref:Secreted protein n=1 Tax=Caerostris extrusa TaxID=172846 RepID=A0AAV4RZ71_CAEEX|nr:hypothetical protein CEXT_193011 [Caerostris extrusa]GIY25165.1 hypothetical protein CEXT_193121 [Caerostris extrusa]
MAEAEKAFQVRFFCWLITAAASRMLSHQPIPGSMRACRTSYMANDSVPGLNREYEAFLYGRYRMSGLSQPRSQVTMLLENSSFAGGALGSNRML